MEAGGSSGQGQNQQDRRPRLLTYPGFKATFEASSLQDQSRSRSNTIKEAGNESPESGSLYSDEIPSGYNSGEQYDTISCGYMSGEAYELPDTRMELREPNLEVIEECSQPLGGSNSGMDSDNMFSMPVISLGTPEGANQNFISHEQEDVDVSSTSSGNEDNKENDSILNAGSPGMINSYGKKLRKKPLSFAIPIEASPLNKNEHDIDIEIYDESSDAGMGDAPTGGYRTVPSDTDTSAVDSDPNAMDGRHKRLGKRKKNFKNHDEAWFLAHDTKKWSRIRFICFWSAIMSMISACVLAGVMIFLMPRNCDPDVDWYQGKVFMDIHGTNVTSLAENLEKFSDMGVTALHWKPLDRNSVKTTEEYLEKINKELTETEISEFFQKVHASNLTIMVQIFVVPDDTNRLSLDIEHRVNLAIEFWTKLGSDGIFLHGLQFFDTDVWIAQKITSWHSLLDRFDQDHERSKILMTSYVFAQHLTAMVEESEAAQALSKISLLDADFNLDLFSNITDLEEDLDRITHWDTIKSRPWINWNLETSNPLSNAALAMQMLLPGTINLNNYTFFETSDNNDSIKNMTNLRALAVPIYMNGNYKRCDCEGGTTKEVNYVIHQPVAETIQMERFYNRRNRYVLVANFGLEDVNLGPVGQIYYGGQLVLDTSQSLPFLDQDMVKFGEIDLPPKEAIVIKLPK